jgi:hypothetical protein
LDLDFFLFGKAISLSLNLQFFELQKSRVPALAHASARSDVQVSAALGAQSSASRFADASYGHREIDLLSNYVIKIYRFSRNKVNLHLFVQQLQVSLILRRRPHRQVNMELVLELQVKGFQAAIASNAQASVKRSM